MKREFFSVREMYDDMAYLLQIAGGETYNYVATINTMSPTAYTMETDLFPVAALDAYTDHNLELPPIEGHRWFSPERGGPQGDYRQGMQAKIDRVVVALRTKPASKRAVLTVPFTDKCALCVKVEDDAEWKCLRELYFRIEDGRLHCTGVMRSQALIIVPKNIHMIGRVMEQVALDLGVKMGSYTHHCVFLVTDRK